MLIHVSVMLLQVGHHHLSGSTDCNISIFSSVLCCRLHLPPAVLVSCCPHLSLQISYPGVLWSSSSSLASTGVFAWQCCHRIFLECAFFILHVYSPNPLSKKWGHITLALLLCFCVSTAVVKGRILRLLSSLQMLFCMNKLCGWQTPALSADELARQLVDMLRLHIVTTQHSSQPRGIYHCFLYLLKRSLTLCPSLMLIYV